MTSSDNLCSDFVSLPVLPERDGNRRISMRRTSFLVTCIVMLIIFSTSFLIPIKNINICIYLQPRGPSRVIKALLVCNYNVRDRNFFTRVTSLVGAIASKTTEVRRQRFLGVIRCWPSIRAANFFSSKCYYLSRTRCSYESWWFWVWRYNIIARSAVQAKLENGRMYGGSFKRCKEIYFERSEPQIWN